MVRTFGFILALPASAGCVAERPRTVSFEGSTYRLVTGKPLRAAFVGNKIRYPDPHGTGEIVVSATRCDGFYPDGAYLSCGDRVPRVTGTFKVHKDRICIAVFRRTFCYQLYRNPAGRYLLGHPGEQPEFEPVSFVPAADESVAPRMY